MTVRILMACALLGAATLALSGCGGGGGGGSSAPTIPVVSSLSFSSDLQRNLAYPNDVTPPAGTIQITPPPARTVATTLSSSYINIGKFTSSFDFTFQSGPSIGDGITFLVENMPPVGIALNGSHARGDAGGYLGYRGITQSVCFKIDTHQNGIDPSANCVGVFTGGVAPFGGDDVSSVLNFHNGDKFHVVLVYDGANLSATITDSGPAATGTFTHSYPVDIPKAVGGSVAFAGFSAASDLAEPQNISNWSMTSQ